MLLNFLYEAFEVALHYVLRAGSKGYYNSERSSFLAFVDIPKS
jgi:hypothetical protein